MAEKSFLWLVLRHVEHEHIGTLATVLEKAGQSFRYLDLFRSEPVPQNMAGFRGLIVMGGPMGVYEADQYPFLEPEQRLIRQAAEDHLPVLGICLGSQLIAAALGARVYPGPQKEIGWYPVEVVRSEDSLTAGLPSRFLAFHWHGDTFDLPREAVRLFRSNLYENQGFRWRNAYGIQFHFEITAGMVEEWLEDEGCRAELASLPDARPQKIREETARWASELERLSAEVFGRFFTQAGASPFKA